jgi:hypothetical protein
MKECDKRNTYKQQSSYMIYIKVNESRNRPGLAQRVPGGLGSQISWHSAREGGEVASFTHRSPLPPGRYLVLIFRRGWVDPRAMVRSEGDMSLKNPVAPPGIDPGTVRLVAQRLNHYAAPVPKWSMYLLIMINTLLLRPSFHFTSSHLNFTHLHFTTLSFGLTPPKFPTAPNSNRVWAYVIVWRLGWRHWRVCCCWLGGGFRFWISALGGKAFCMEIRVLAVALCRRLRGCQRFEEPCCLHLHVRKVQYFELLDPWRLRQYVPCNAVNGSSNYTSSHRRRPEPSESALGEHQTQEKLRISGTECSKVLIALTTSLH